MLKGIFRTKNLDDIMASIGGPQFSMKRTLGAFNVTLIGFAGVFDAAFGSGGEDHNRALAGVLLIALGLVLGVLGSITGATGDQTDSAEYRRKAGTPRR